MGGRGIRASPAPRRRRLVGAAPGALVLTTKLETRTDGAAVISGTAEPEIGARAALLSARGLLRLDVVAQEDVLGLIVRNLSSAEMRVEDGSGYASAPVIERVVRSSSVPACFEVVARFATSPEATEARIIATAVVRPAEGRLRIVAQAIVAVGARGSESGDR